MIKPRYFCFLSLLLLVCCRKPYNPPAINAPNSYLVVEGAINSGGDSTIIKLSKTVNLGTSTTANPVLGATVTVESDQNNSWPLVGDGSGNYVSPGLNLSSTQSYRLRIKTSNGDQYVSDFTPVLNTPPIDSIGYTQVKNGIQLYVNSHDPTNAAKYFRWDYQETWIFHSKFESEFMLKPGTDTIVPRTRAQSVYYCFANDVSSNLILNSTAKLSKDIVYQSPLITIPYTSEKLEVEYSILVRQYALTGDAYLFYQNIKKNTEQLGSIFDAQPSQLIGNIHSLSNVNEPVIGYITVTNPQSKRIFLTSAAVPVNTSTNYPYQCEEDTALYVDKQGYNDVQNVLISQPPAYLPTRGIYNPLGVIIGYLYSTPDCTDCTIRGTTKTPSFWK